MNKIISIADASGGLILSAEMTETGEFINIVEKDGYRFEICDEEDYKVEITGNGRVLPKIKRKVIN